MQSSNSTYLAAAYHVISQSTSCVPCNQATYISMTCVQNHAINQSIYKLYVMQLISTIEADSKVISLLVNLLCTAITRLSVSSLANVSIRKIKVRKGVFARWPQWLAVCK